VKQIIFEQRRVFYLQLAADPSHLLHTTWKKNEKLMEEKSDQEKMEC
jgi:hypothetical protein